MVFNKAIMEVIPAKPSVGPGGTPPLAISQDEFHALIDRTSKRLFRLAARLSGSELDAQDILQESYLRAYRGLAERKGFDPKATLDTWLYSIVTNVALNWVRDRQRLKVREGHLVPPVESTSGAAEARVALRELSKVLDLLPAEQRIALVLKEIEGLSAKEVATVLGISEGAVEQRLVRARETIREKVRHG